MERQQESQYFSGPYSSDSMLLRIQLTGLSSWISYLPLLLMTINCYGNVFFIGDGKDFLLATVVELVTPHVNAIMSSMVTAKNCSSSFISGMGATQR